MNSDQFCWWLHGFFEISKADELTKEQVQEIQNHLGLLFNKITPNLGEASVPLITHPIAWPITSEHTHEYCFSNNENRQVPDCSSILKPLCNVSC